MEAESNSFQSGADELAEKITGLVDLVENVYSQGFDSEGPAVYAAKQVINELWCNMGINREDNRACRVELLFELVESDNPYVRHVAVDQASRFWYTKIDKDKQLSLDILRILSTDADEIVQHKVQKELSSMLYGQQLQPDDILSLNAIFRAVT